MFHARIARTVYGATDPKKKILKPQTLIEGGAAGGGVRLRS
jgi:hypothetical protein